MMTDSDSTLPLSFESLLEGAPDAVVVHDLQGRVLYWNAAAEALYGWSSAEMLGCSAERVLYLDASARTQALEILLREGGWEGQLLQMDKPGREHVVSVRQQVYRDSTGEVVAVVSFNSPVSEVEALGGQASVLFTSKMGHQLNNTLAPIILASAMLKGMVKDSKVLRMLTMIETCASNASDLVAEMLAPVRDQADAEERDSEG